MKNVVIIGAGGHAKVVADIVTKTGDNVVGFLDDDLSKQNSIIYLNKKVIGTIDDVEKYLDYYFIIAIGCNKNRKRIFENYNLKLYTAVHPNSIIANDVEIGDGSVIMAGVIINPGVKIGSNCIVNTSSSIDHDSSIGNYVHISPGSHLAGNVKVDDGTWIGTGVSVINNIVIGKNNIIGAGSVIIRDILGENSTYVGVPAKKIK